MANHRTILLIKIFSTAKAKHYTILYNSVLQGGNFAVLILINNNWISSYIHYHVSSSNIIELFLYSIIFVCYECFCSCVINSSFYFTILGSCTASFPS